MEGCARYVCSCTGCGDHGGEEYEGDGRDAEWQHRPGGTSHTNHDLYLLKELGGWRKKKGGSGDGSELDMG